MNVQMVSSETKKIGNSIISNVEDLENNIKRLYSIIENLNTVWKSEAATDYINVMLEQNIPELQKLCHTLRKYGNFMNNIPSAYETLDEIFASKGFDF